MEKIQEFGCVVKENTLFLLMLEVKVIDTDLK